MNVKNPDHYARWVIEPIEFIRANRLDAIRANIIKYIMRYDVKDGMKDLEKAQVYLDMLKEDWAKESGTMTDWDVREAEKALYEGQKAPQGATLRAKTDHWS